MDHWIARELDVQYKKLSDKNGKIAQSSEVYETAKKIYEANGDNPEFVECFYILYFDRNNNNIGWYKISQGGIAGTVVDLKLIVATACGCLASAAICIHNHPSGNTNPSVSDNKITERIKMALDLVDIQLLDHLIITEDGYYSYADEGVI